MSKAAEILRLARTVGVRISTAESCTGGMIAESLTDLPGSSAIFEYGFVTYSNKAKVDMLGVPQAALDDFGAVSEQVTEAMAEGARRRSGADIAVSVSGIAGPGGSVHKPEGRVCFGLATSSKTKTQTVDFGALGRDAVRAAATEHALGLILRVLTED